MNDHLYRHGTEEAEEKQPVEITGAPAIKRKAEAKAKALGITVDELLEKLIDAEWARQGGESEITRKLEAKAKAAGITVDELVERASP